MTNAPPIRTFIFQLAHTITSALYSSEFRNRCAEHITHVASQTYLREVSVENTIQHVYSFFLKGGNTLPFLNSPYRREFIFDSDFDFTLLINPNLSATDFTALRTIIIKHCVEIVQRSIADSGRWNDIYEVYQRTIGPLYSRDLPRKLITIKDSALSPDNFELSRTLYESSALRTWSIPEQCPFDFIIYPNVSYISHGVPMTANVALLKVVLRPRPEEIIDISFPAHSHDLLPYEWNSHKEFKVITEGGFHFYVSDPLSVFLDQRLAAISNSRENKRRRRTRRANYIRNTILRPRRNTYRNRINRIRANVRTASIARDI